MRPYSANSRLNHPTSSPNPKSLTHKKDKYSFHQETRFINLNANLLQTIEGSSKKIMPQTEKIMKTEPLWDNLLSKTTNSIFKNQRKPDFEKNKSTVFDPKNDKRTGKKFLSRNEFEKGLSKVESLKVDDPKVEKLKKTIFCNFSNNADFYSLSYKNNFHTENKREFQKPEISSQPKFSNLLLEYKLGEFEPRNEKKTTNQDFNKKSPRQKLGKKPEFINDLQKPSFYLFTKFGE